MAARARRCVRASRLGPPPWANERNERPDRLWGSLVCPHPRSSPARAPRRVTALRRGRPQRRLGWRDPRSVASRDAAASGDRAAAEPRLSRGRAARLAPRGVAALHCRRRGVAAQNAKFRRPLARSLARSRAATARGVRCGAASGGSRESFYEIDAAGPSQCERARRRRAARLINSWLVTPIGLVDVTSRCQFRAAGLSMVVTPERRMSARFSFGPGRAWAWSP